MARQIIIAIFLLVPAAAAAQPASDPESATRAALRAFIDAWNTGDNVELRRTMNFPFVTLFGSRLVVAQEPDDFATDFDSMRQRNDWVRSSFDFGSLEIFAVSDTKVHCAIDFHRYDSAGSAYMSGRVLYVVTRIDGRWGLQLRTGIGGGELDVAERETALGGARSAVREFFEAFNGGDSDAVTKPLNYPHVFMTPTGGFALAQDASAPSVRPNFERMRSSQGWYVSTIDSIEASYVSPSTVHFDIVFSRWHLDGTRYLTIPALWVVTEQDGHWGIQLRSLMAPTLSE